MNFLKSKKKNVKLYPKNIVGIIFYNSLLLGQFNRLEMQIHICDLRNAFKLQRTICILLWERCDYYLNKPD